MATDGCTVAGHLYGAGVLFNGHCVYDHLNFWILLYYDEILWFIFDAFIYAKESGNRNQQTIIVKHSNTHRYRSYRAVSETISL